MRETLYLIWGLLLLLHRGSVPSERAGSRSRFPPVQRGFTLPTACFGAAESCLGEV